MQPQNEWGSCDGVDKHHSCFGVTFRACVPLSSEQSPTLQQKGVSWATALSSIHRKAETFVPGVLLWSRSRKQGWYAQKSREAKIFKPSVLLLLLYMVQQRMEGIAFCCSSLVFYTMAIKSVQLFGPEDCACLSAFARQSSFMVAECRGRRWAKRSHNGEECPKQN